MRGQSLGPSLGPRWVPTAPDGIWLSRHRWLLPSFYCLDVCSHRRLRARLPGIIMSAFNGRLRLPSYISVLVFTCLFAYHSAIRSICLHVCLFARLSVCLPVCVIVCSRDQAIPAIYQRKEAPCHLASTTHSSRPWRSSATEDASALWQRRALPPAKKRAPAGDVTSAPFSGGLRRRVDDVERIRALGCQRSLPLLP